ncbi:MAG: DUF2914 domain-containing protein [Candidatus Omnitrophica bacterium]|nr:DUF2914 domain-containing protein [Candidatus Omnitrophota bacterium]
MVINQLKNWYGKYERIISSLSLVGGFVFDALTLKRVDLFWENVWVVGHLVIVGTCIVLVHALDKGEGDDLGAEALAKAAADSSKAHFWLVNILQFFFGGILSTYLVFYFRSSDILVAWPFLLILALSFAANEVLKRHFVRLAFQISQLYLSIFAFAVFIVPVILHKIGDGIFILSGASSLAIIGLYLLVLNYFSKKPIKRSWKTIAISISGIFIMMNAFYFSKLLPPIPLSLKDAGVFYSIARNFQGDYSAVAEQKGWLEYFTLYPDFHYLPSQPVYVYSAVFSPSGLNTDVSHQWQKQDSAGKWVTIDSVPLKVVGGRDGGFRTYSQKTFNLSPGRWRVNVQNNRGQIIGRVRFNLVSADVLPKVIEEIKE